MGLIPRNPSPAQSLASRANGQRSRGPASERGKAISSRNALKARPFSKAVTRSMQALGERPGDFERTRKILGAAMAPRDGWEQAWVQDIAILRWRLERLLRAEVGLLAIRKRKLAGKRQREAAPASGLADLALRQSVAVTGFTGLPDSPWKFQQVLEFLRQLRGIVRSNMFEPDTKPYFTLLYGKQPGIVGATLQGRFNALSERLAQGQFREGENGQIALIADLNQEIEQYEQKQALYEAEHRADDPVREDADLLLPREELSDLIRYETHLEDQIERKLRQFYARRRESVAFMIETLPPTTAEIEAGEPAGLTASAEA